MEPNGQWWAVRASKAFSASPALARCRFFLLHYKCFFSFFSYFIIHIYFSQIYYIYAAAISHSGWLDALFPFCACMYNSAPCVVSG